MRISITKRSLSIAVLGAFAFWTPSVFLHAVRQYSFSSQDGRLLTILIPLVNFTVFVVIWRFIYRSERRLFIALPMLVGIWVSGPLFIMISASFAGGGFAKSGAWLYVIISTLLFPMMTFYFSLFDGTLGALLIVTLGLALFSLDWLLLQEIKQQLKAELE